MFCSQCSKTCCFLMCLFLFIVFSVDFSCLAEEMEIQRLTLLKRINEEGFELDFDPVGDGNCFYEAAGHQLGLVKNLIFDYLSTHRFDVCTLSYQI